MDFFMEYNFDNVIDRHNTNSAKWDGGNADLLPMWVADMDFEVPQPVKDAIAKRAEHGIFGYSLPRKSYYEAIISWEKRRHGWAIEKEWITFSPGIVPAVHMLIRALAQPGDKVIVQTPVYYPFFNAILNNGCQIKKNSLKLPEKKYVMDFEDLERKVKDPRAKLLILCSPHNPVGRVWRREELVRLGELCLQHDVTVISDEIHCDLIFKGHKHLPFAALDERFAQNSMTCIAPSKTFNLAGLQTSAVIIPNARIRDRFTNVLASGGLKMPNPFGIAALEAAYNQGEPWLEQLMVYLSGNVDFLMRFVEERLPMVEVIKPEGTYLVWMDFRKLGLDPDALEGLMLKKARVWLDEGYIFGQEGQGFERINVACPRSVLNQGLQRIETAVNSL
jgi:cystathionine beta-lyase